MSNRYTINVNALTTEVHSTYLVRDLDSGRALGGCGASFHRPWVFPLYTPSGLTIVQEFPYDHPFHNGMFVGQHPVRVGDREGNFWAIPLTRAPAGTDTIMTRIGRISTPSHPTQTITRDRASFRFATTWLDERGQSLIDEQRFVSFWAMNDATICDVVSRKIATHGAARFPKTKYGSIGIRVEPRLLPPMGGQVLAATGGVLRRGGADEVASGKACDFVAYEAAAHNGNRFGVCLCILDNSASIDRTGPWFIRDYGMAMFNATMLQDIVIAADEAWTIGLRVIAYDGPLTIDRVALWKGFQHES